MVILDIKDYTDEANRQLNDTNNYEQLDFDPTELHTEKIKSEINNLKNENLLTLRPANSVFEEKIKTPEFHLLPKIHKANNPGRPVISSVNCHTSRISEFVDYYLQPEVKKLKSYVKDTTELILTLSNFVFNGINYLQKKGCAMGTKCAPSYANIFMGWFEGKFIFPLLTNLSDFYQRFIDDIFLIWNGTKTEFDNFLKKINECHPSIKFEYEMSKTEITFLDTTVFKEDNKLRTKLYVKPTDSQSYLHSKSEHPNSTKKSIAYSQALRLNKICYNRSDLHNNCERLLNTLTKRGYNKTDTTTQINRAITIPRNELLNQIKTSNTERLPLTVTYNRTLLDLKTIIDKNWHILQIEPKLKEIFAEPPILAFNRNKNLRDIIGGNKLFDNKKILNVKKFNKRKCQPCFTRSVNLCCKQLKTCSTFQSAFNENTFLIRHNVTCKSSCVIYLMECCLSEKSQYVGKSEYSVNLRINTHRNDVWRTDGPPCDKHFQMPSHNFNTYAKFTIIEEVYNKSLSKLKIRSLLEHREDFWILKLQTLSPQGLSISRNYPQDTTGSIW